MNITPLEIRQKTFEKGFRGYDKDEVTAFLTSLSQEWQRLNEETKELRIKLEGSEKEVQKLREVEDSLFKTLKTAENTGANMVEQATKSAELQLKEAQIKCEEMVNDAKHRAQSIVEEAQQKARQALVAMEKEIQSLSQVHRQLESHRDNLLGGLQSLAQETQEKVEKVKSERKSLDLNSITHNAQKLLGDILADIKNVPAESKPYSFDVAPSEENLTENEPSPQPEKPSKSTSFFDEIE